MQFRVTVPRNSAGERRATAGECVFPVYGSGNGYSRRFSGSSFFVAGPAGPLLVTAAHVVRDQPSLEIATLPDDAVNFPLGARYSAKYRSAALVAISQEHDLALLNVEGFEPPNVFKLDTSFDTANTPLICIELSRSTDSHCEQSTRTGNLVRLVNDGYFPPNSLELSFPALRGASGSPVFHTKNDCLTACGVVKGNAAYELLPVEIYSVVDEIAGRPITETTKFCLPQGIAVHALHLESLIKSTEVTAEDAHG